MSPTFQSARLVVGGLTRNTTEGHLKEIFGHYGVLRSVHIAMDQHAGLPKGFAHLEFDFRDDAERALDFMHGGQIDGNVVRCATRFLHFWTCLVTVYHGWGSVRGW